jgi:hypothetical protein
MDFSKGVECQPAVEQALLERRREVRYAASGPVQLHVQEELETAAATVDGELVDRSRGGCKVRHWFGILKTGQQVTVVLDEKEIPAIAVWTKKVSDHYESGFSFVR